MAGGGVPGLHQLEGRGGGEAHRWQAARPRPRGRGSPGRYFRQRSVAMYSHRASSMTRTLFTEGMARKSKVSRLLRGESMRWWRSVPVRRDAQVVMVHILGGALGGQLAVLPEEGGQPQFLQVSTLTGCSFPGSGPCSPWRWLHGEVQVKPGGASFQVTQQQVLHGVEAGSQPLLHRVVAGERVSSRRPGRTPACPSDGLQRRRSVDSSGQPGPGGCSKRAGSAGALSYVRARSTGP